MKVSILVPVHGVEKYIEKSARSVLGQSYRDIEYIFVDDASPDRSIEILREVLKDYPDRDVKVVVNPRNLGLAATRNVAVDNATGDYILHVDSDDHLADGAVEMLAAKAAETDADIVVFDSVDVFGDFEFTHRDPHPYAAKEDYIRAVLHRRVRVTLWSKLLRRDLYRTVRAVPGLDNGEDFQVLPQLVYHASRIVKLDEPLYYYTRCNPGAISASLSPARAEQMVRGAEVVERFFASVPDTAVYAPMIAGMKVHNKIALLQAGDRSAWEYARGLYPGLDHSGVRLSFPQRAALWLARAGAWRAMGLYRRLAMTRRRLRG